MPATNPITGRLTGNPNYRSRPNSAAASARLVFLKACIAQGMTCRQIQDLEGTTKSSVANFCARHGLQPRAHDLSPKPKTPKISAPKAPAAPKKRQNRAPTSAARSDGEGDILPLVIPVAPNLVLSLMARGLSREKAVEQAVVYTTNQERKQREIAVSRRVDRLSSCSSSQSLHIPTMEQTSCQRPTRITTRSDQIRPTICGTNQ